jgi:peptide/nickel transport system permease protein
LGRILGEVGRAAIHLLAASALAFFIVRAMPGDPAALLLLAQGQAADPATVAALHAQWGLDRSLPGQYAAWLGDFLAGDWRTSFRTGRPIFEEFAARLPVTLTVGFGAFALALGIAGPLAEAAAARPHGWQDRVLDAATLGAQAVPGFWLGCLLIWVFAVELRAIALFEAGPQRYVLPIAVVALAVLGPLAQVYRAGLREVARSDYVRAALARGAPRARVVAQQGRRYAALGLLSTAAAEAGTVVGGTAVVETVFGLPGIGQFVVDSIAVRDFFVLQAFFMVAVAWMLLASLAARSARRLVAPGGFCDVAP